MNIKSVETKHIITENAIAGVVEFQTEFTPYFLCIIATDNGRFYGKGQTNEEASRDAVEDMQAAHAQANEVKKAISEYNAKQNKVSTLLTAN